MKIDGRKIAEEIRDELRTKIEELSNRGIVPKIAIITLGEESSWETYVRQKIKVAGELGIKAVLINLEDAGEEKLVRTVREIDSNSTYHGIIIQRPIPKSFDREKVVNSISPEKDIDGFRSNSKFEVPVWLAVKRLLAESLLRLDIHKGWREFVFVVIGKGETAGAPVIHSLKQLGIEPQVMDSKTENSDQILKSADIIISCVGKSNIIKVEQIKKGAILIGVGIRGEDGTVKGDYNEEEIKKVAVAYTPTPGGVGPVNLSYLFKNLMEATKNQNAS